MTEIVSANAVLNTALNLEAFWRARDDTSFDPYDGLETDRMPWLASLPQVVQLAVVQLNKRSPVNLRRLSGVRPTHNAYAVAHFASACALLSPYSAGGVGGGLDGALSRRLDWLCDTRVEGAWAYPFDVQTKTFAYRKTVPNLICTAFAVAALLDGLSHIEAVSQVAGRAGEGGTVSGVEPDVASGVGSDVTDEDRARARERWGDAVRGAVSFTLERLLSRREGRVYFRYLEPETLLIHNANVLGARLVARAGTVFGEQAWIDTARESLPVTVGAISSDGLLPYGEGSHEAWVDGHHTGFVAEALADLSVLLDDPGLDEVATTVRGAYRRSLFGLDGRPLLYPGRRFPIDVITGAQGIQTFAKTGSSSDVAFSRGIAGFMLAHMRTRAGNFVYRKGRAHVKSVPYVRWSDAPMCLSLAHLARAMHPSVPASSPSPIRAPGSDSVPA